MTSKSGKHTGELGKRLTGGPTGKLKTKPKYHVYYAHGDKDGGSNVCNRCTPFFGKYSTASTLSFVDIVVVDTKNKKVRTLCEIEERSATPKKILGDIINIMLSDKLRIKEVDYKYDKTRLIIGIKVKENGKAETKANALIKRLKSIIKKRSWNLFDEIKIICCSDINKLIDKVEKEILDSTSIVTL